MSIFNRKSIARLRRMVEALRSRDLSLWFATDGLRGEEKKLAEEINGVVSDFRAEQIRQEALYGCYEAMLNQVNAALIVAADNDDEVRWMNDKAVSGLCGYRVHSLGMLKAVNPDLPDVLRSLKAGEERLVNMRVDDHETQLKISMVRYSQQGVESRLFSIENVQFVLQQSELDAQRKLVSVLTHEIMNSLSPIISLSDSLCEVCAEGTPLDDDSLRALNAIHRRSSGLLTFVENYRRLSKLSPPDAAWVKVADIIEVVRNLFPEPYIRYEVEDDDIELHLDARQMEQVLINLVKNAREACANVEVLAIEVRTHADHAVRRFLITVTDNGEGITPATIDKVFVPFFTTKQHGSGIGLALSRQIVSAHGGIIKVRSDAGSTTFTVSLPLDYR